MKAHGREADTPRAFDRQAWIQVLKRTLSESSRDNVGIVAAGVAFLSLLALFPGLSAAFALWGLVADPAQIEQQVEGLSSLLPQEAYSVLADQMRQLAQNAGGQLGIGLAVSIAVALWGAAGGVKALMTALNIVYDEEERRSFIRFTLTALALTLGLILMLMLMVALVVVVPPLLGILGQGGWAEWLVRILRWPLLGLALVLALAILYRYGPCRANARMRWLTWGATAATVLWLLGSIAFSIYISNFANYNATYGALGAAIILLLWLYLGAYAVLLGAELNAEMEHQTARDSTTGPPRPMGQRGAHAADTLGR